MKSQKQRRPGVYIHVSKLLTLAAVKLGALESGISKLGVYSSRTYAWVTNKS